jgi:DNA-binding transcriptional MerR regulator
MSGKWRIEELRELAVRALELVPPIGQSSGRVSEVPDVRMIRYYTTIGLIDRPAEMRGRTAFYGPRHLRQLVAVKKLQAQGMSLVEVQESLAGASAKKLDQLAALPAGFIEAALETRLEPLETRFEMKRDARQASALGKRAAESASTRDRQRFWSAAPDVTPRGPAEASTLSEPRVLPRQLAVILPLDTGVSLVLEGVAPEQLNREIVASLQPAVDVLCDALVRTGLSRRSHDVDTNQIDEHRKSEEGPR